jgi:hypothetical protein
VSEVIKAAAADQQSFGRSLGIKLARVEGRQNFLDVKGGSAFG